MTRPSATVEWWWTSSASVAKRLSDVTYTCRGGWGAGMEVGEGKEEEGDASSKLDSYFTLINVTEPFHQRLCWSGNGRLSLHSGEILTAVRDCFRFPWRGNYHWWGKTAGTQQHCVIQVHGTSYASLDCWQAWCNWRAPNPGRSLNALHSTLHSGCNPVHAASHLDGQRQHAGFGPIRMDTVL